MLPPATDWHGFHNFRITFHSLSGTSLCRRMVYSAQVLGKPGSLHCRLISTVLAAAFRAFTAAKPLRTQGSAA